MKRVREYLLYVSNKDIKFLQEVINFFIFFLFVILVVATKPHNLLMSFSVFFEIYKYLLQIVIKGSELQSKYLFLSLMKGDGLI